MGVYGPPAPISFSRARLAPPIINTTGQVDSTGCFICCYLVAIHLFPLYFPGNKLRHSSECTTLKAVFKIVQGDHAPGPIKFPKASHHAFSTCSAHPTTSPIILLRGITAAGKVKWHAIVLTLCISVDMCDYMI